MTTSGEHGYLTTTALRGSPFYLDGKGMRWVNDTLTSLSVRQKVGQLFCLAVSPSGIEQIDQEFAVCEPGGYLHRPTPGAVVQELNTYIRSESTVPVIIAANLEAGADGAFIEGTPFGSPLQVAATNVPSNAYRMAAVAATQARSLGFHWNFAPVADIQLNFRNPITLNRCFGSDVARVTAMTNQAIRGLQDNYIAATTKHWPGDGVDDRDQHLLTTVNTLSVPEWEETYGQVYKAAIEAGTKTIMAGHIALPSYSRELHPNLEDSDILPASLSYDLTTELLRHKLGFKGLVITDASTMAGALLPMPRDQALTHAILAGCDMLLFSVDYAEDFNSVLRDVESGVIPLARLNEAVTRILALKASVGLHEQPLSPTPELTQGQVHQHEAWAMEVAQTGITLVKNKEQVLPLDPGKYPRVLVHYMHRPNTTAAPLNTLCRLLAERGFQVAVSGSSPEAKMGPRVVGKFDVAIYLADIGPVSNESSARLPWQPDGSDVPAYITHLPTIFISLGSPFHLQDVPRVKTFINAYARSTTTVVALVSKLLGDEPFTGINPVDPFCGYWDARL